MPTLQKQQTVEEFVSQAKSAKGLVVTSFKALKTTEFNELRAKLRPLESEYRVVKNSLTHIALKNAGLEELAKVFEGPTAIVIERGAIKEARSSPPRRTLRGLLHTN
jgi:large subunit ribosomal protein L10